MILDASVDDMRRHFHSETDGHPRLGKFLLPWPGAMPINVSPCSRIGEREMVGSDANNGAVLVMPLLRVKRHYTTGMKDGPWPRKCAAEKCPRVISQMVEENVIDTSCNLMGEDLSICKISRPVRKSTVEKSGILQ